MITREEPGFLYLCRLLRDDWRQLRGYTVKDLKFRPGTGGCSASYDWTGLDDALLKPGADVEPPSKTIAVKARKLSTGERESLGRTAHRNWVAVRKQQRADGQAVPHEDLQGWVELSEENGELFRRSGETLALPEELMWRAVEAMRETMGEKAFRKKIFDGNATCPYGLQNPKAQAAVLGSMFPILALR